MQQWQQTTMEEKRDLDLKLDNIQFFLGSPAFKSLDRNERVRLTQQARIMKEYSRVLEQRINAFEIELGKGA